MFGFRRRRRARLRARPLDPALSQRLGRAVPYLRRLTPAERAALEGHAQVLLHEKRFEGCGGLVLTDEMRLVIAAQAALLLLNRPTEYFPTLQGVLVYPQRYVVDAVRPLPGGIVSEGPEARAGEAWYRGSVVLSWLDVLRGAANDHDGDNVVLHEFAHQLDSESGANEGAQRLAEAAARAGGRASWARHTRSSRRTWRPGERGCCGRTRRPARRSSSRWPRRCSSSGRQRCATSTRTCTPRCGHIFSRIRPRGSNRERTFVNEAGGHYGVSVRPARASVSSSGRIRSSRAAGAASRARWRTDTGASSGAAAVPRAGCRG